MVWRWRTATKLYLNLIRQRLLQTVDQMIKYIADV